MSEDTANFLQCFGDDFFIQTFDDKKKGNRHALTERRWALQDIEKKKAVLMKLNERHSAGVYFCVNALKEGTRRNSDNVDAVRAFFIDLDGAPLQPVIDWGLSESGLQPNIVVKSSHGRWHCYWLMDDYYPDANKLFRDVQRWLADKFKADRSVSDLCRVMRLPGFFNMKNNPVMVEWEQQRIKYYKLQEIKDVMDADKAARNIDIVGQPVGISSIAAVDYIPLDILLADVGRGGAKNAEDDFAFDQSRLRGALLAIPADDYDLWLRIGMALQGAARRPDAELSEEEAFEYWLTWSATSDKFDDTALEEKWQGLNARGELGLGTVFELARQHGWNGTSGRTVEQVKAAQPEVRGIVAKTVIDATTPEGKILAARFK